MRNIWFAVVLTPILASCGVVATGMAAGNAYSIADINRRLADFELVVMDKDCGDDMRRPDSETVTVGSKVFLYGKPRQANNESYAVLVPLHKHSGALLQLASTRESFKMIPEKFSHLMRVAPFESGSYVFQVPDGRYRLLIVDAKIKKVSLGRQAVYTHYVATIQTSEQKTPLPTHVRRGDDWDVSAVQTTRLFKILPALTTPSSTNWKQRSKK